MGLKNRVPIKCDVDIGQNITQITVLDLVRARKLFGSVEKADEKFCSYA